MKQRIIEIFRLLLGVVALVCTMFIAFGRLCWKTIRDWWRNRSERLKKWTKAVIISVVLIFVGITCYDFCDSMWGRYEWGDENISENVEIRYFKNGDKRVYNTQTREYTTSGFDWITTSENEIPIAVYAKDGKRGYIDQLTGEIIVDADKNSYEKAWVFSEGLAAVMQNDKIGFINPEGEVVIPFQYDYTDECSMWDFGIVFHEGLCCMTNAEGQIGLINQKGEWVLYPEYDEIWVPRHGHRILIKDSVYGVADTDGRVIYPVTYGYIDILEDSFVLTKGGKRWEEDREGKIITGFMFDETDDLLYVNYYNQDGETVYSTSDYVSYQIIQRYGIMNRYTGEPLTPAIYRDIQMVSYCLFKVQTENMDWILIDTKGNLVN